MASKISYIARKITASYKYLIFPFHKKSYSGKVFCIGYNKTGTTTLGKSFEMLGYRNSSFNKKVWRQFYANKEFNKILEYTSKFDSFDDLPWLKEDMIPILDKTFPKSKFIYLTREEESWKKSFYNWRYKVMGKYPDADKAWIAYKKHEKFVYEYFKDRPSSDFIVLDVRDEKGFKKLADFLGKKTNIEKFPHFNKT